MSGAPAHSAFPGYSWRNSYWVVILIGILIGFLAVAASLTLDWVMQQTIRPLYASDLLEGLAAGVLSSVVLVRMQSRRRELLRRMQIVEDVNHHVRNALTAISLSASLREDSELNVLVRDACDRVDWVLSDVLSQAVDAKDVDLRHSSWSSGRQIERSDSKQRAIQKK
ncbi:MAG: hypothetical protein ACYCSN_14190 [Acidobacteriaceae bacterium]